MLINPLNIDVLSIQSQVVYGHVGNNAVVPIVQNSGFNICAIPTVYLSNTPLYPSVYGGVIDIEWFKGYLKAIEERKLLTHCRYITLGYLGSVEQAQVLCQWLEKIRKNHPEIFILIDPVLGDSDCGLYVNPALAGEYRHHLRHLASGMTPNHFELEYLVDKKLNSIEETIVAAQSLLNKHCQWVITTTAAPKTWQEGQTQLLIVDKNGYELQTHPFYPTKAQGTGDSFTANLIVALLQKKALNQAVKLASQAVMNIVLRTNKEHSNELQLISSLKSPKNDL